MNQARERGRRWCLVLSGGDGQRMRSFTSAWLGEPRPKQYCAFTGTRTMLEHTLERALDVASEERVVTVLGAGHRRWTAGLSLRGRLLDQPANRGTGPGILFGLAHILAEDPEAVVTVMPSDHFIAPRFVFRERLLQALELAESLPGHIVLATARPDRPEADYGWVELSDSLPGRSRASSVRRFVEKPPRAEADELCAAGAVWNTMILCARAGALLAAAWENEPEMAGRFQALRAFLNTEYDEAIRDDVYDAQPTVDFSSAVLQPSASRLVSLALDGVHWCDWGRPARVFHTLRVLGLEPNFPAEPTAAAWIGAAPKPVLA